MAALCTFVWQSVALQTHLHLAAPRSAGVAATAIAGFSAPESGDDRATCPICQDAAHFGNYLSPAALAVPVMLAMVACFGTVAFLRWPPRHASPGWYGRGPPAGPNALPTV